MIETSRDHTKHGSAIFRFDIQIAMKPPGLLSVDQNQGL